MQPACLRIRKFVSLSTRFGGKEAEKGGEGRSPKGEIGPSAIGGEEGVGEQRSATEGADLCHHRGAGVLARLLGTYAINEYLCADNPTENV